MRRFATFHLSVVRGILCLRISIVHGIAALRSLDAIGQHAVPGAALAIKKEA
jgi:hypothetical protein